MWKDTVRQLKILPKPARSPLIWWSLGSLLMSVPAGVLGFGDILAGAARVSKVLFILFLVVFFVAGTLALRSRRGSPNER